MSNETSDPRVRTASHALVSAALGGLLCLGTACSSSNNTHSNPASGGSGGASTGGTGGGATGGSGGTAAGGTGGTGTAGSGGSATGGTGGSATGGTGGATGGTGGSATDGGADASTDASTDAANDASTDAADAAAYVYCSNAPDAGTVTSSMTMAMTQAQFQSLCDSNGGTFEIMPHCGGFNTCMGFSYDIGSQVLSQHTCRGLNTCGGYSCVVCGDAGTP